MKKSAVFAAVATFLIAAGALAADDTGDDPFPVYAIVPTWQNSGVEVKAGQHVEVEADPKDTWDIGWGPTSAAGYSYQHDPNAGIPQFHPGTINNDWHWGALICAEGKDRKEAEQPQNEVVIGLKRGFTVDRDGFLYFICNDARYADNTGVVHVKITVTDQPATKMGTGAFDARADFSGAENPHGPWSYGWSDNLKGKLHIYPDKYLRFSGTFWTDQSIEQSWVPICGYHPLHLDEDPLAPEKSMILHPGPGGECSRCVWTAPKAGIYDIDASFAAIDVGDPHGYVQVDGATLGDCQLRRGQPWSKSFKSVKVAAGDTIEAAVGLGNSHSYYNDNTVFSLTITPADTENSTYDAKADFSGTENPHGAWTYGWTDELNGKLHVYADTYVKYDGTNWTDDSILDSGAPQVAYNSRFEPREAHIPAQVMLIHPGPQGEYSHCQCTIQTAGVYDIDASFAALDIGDPHAYILKNGKTMGDAILSRGSPWTKSFKKLGLAAGDTIDMVAGVGNSGSFHNDETQFSLTIKPAQDERDASADVTALVLKQIQAPLKEMVEEAVTKALKDNESSHPAATPSPTPASSPSPAQEENPVPPGNMNSADGLRN